MSQTKKKPGFLKRLIRLTRFLMRAVTIMGSGWLLYSRFAIPRKGQASHALGGERREIKLGDVNVSYYRSGAGKPLVILHDIGIATSAYDVKVLYDHFTATHQVYVPEWPGYGFSERSDIPYSSRLYTDILNEFISSLIVPEDGPVDVIAVGLSAEIAARAAKEAPENFSSLSLISPSSLQSPLAQMNLNSDTLLTLLQAPLWKRALYDLLTTRRALQLQLSQQFGRTRLDEGMLNYAYLIAHQPGAHHAPIYYLSGKFSSPDINNIYDSLTLPVIAITGSGFIKGWDALRTFEDRANWHAVRLDGVRGMPHLELPSKVKASLSAFLEDYALPALTD